MMFPFYRDTDWTVPLQVIVGIMVSLLVAACLIFPGGFLVTQIIQALS